jgi:hypothetical protein
MTDLFVTEDNCPYLLKSDVPDETEMPESEVDDFEDTYKDYFEETISTKNSTQNPSNQKTSNSPSNPRKTNLSTTQFKNISFAGCGFMGVYHIGAASALKQFCAPFIKNMDKIYGCSMGSLMGTALLCDLNLGDLTKHVLEIAEEARKRPLGPMHPKFDVSKELKNRLDLILPEDIHIRATGKMHISMTRVSDKKSIIVSEFSTRQSYLDALFCSCFVPFYSGLIPPTFENTAYVDGGLSDNLPGSDFDTVRISPFSGNSSISPKDDTFSAGHIMLSNNSFDLNLENLQRLTMAFFPPDNEKIVDLCRKGYYDAYEFAKVNGLMEVKKEGKKGRKRLFTSQLEENDRFNYVFKKSDQDIQNKYFHPELDLENIDPLPDSVKNSISEAKVNSERVTRRVMKLARTMSLPIVYPFYTGVNNMKHFFTAVTWVPRLSKMMIVSGKTLIFGLFK